MTLDIKLFIDQKLANKYECPICLNIAYPVYEIVECGHFYCHDDISKLKKCAKCRCTNMNYHESISHTRDIGNLYVNTEKKQTLVEYLRSEKDKKDHKKESETKENNNLIRRIDTESKTTNNGFTMRIDKKNFDKILINHLNHLSKVLEFNYTFGLDGTIIKDDEHNCSINNPIIVSLNNNNNNNNNALLLGDERNTLAIIKTSSILYYLGKIIYANHKANTLIYSNGNNIYFTIQNYNKQSFKLNNMIIKDFEIIINNSKILGELIKEKHKYKLLKISFFNLNYLQFNFSDERTEITYVVPFLRL